MRSTKPSVSAIRPSSLLFGVLPAAVIVALSLPACSDDNNGGRTTDLNYTDPNCSRLTCASLGKNCGVVTDNCGGTLRCGTCAGSGNDCRDNVCERSCVSNSECPSGTACVSGSCSDTCITSQDCPAGQSCNGTTCVSGGGQSCNSDYDCRAGDRCVSGICGGDAFGSYARSCSLDSQCGTAEVCRNSTCVSVNARVCYRDGDCRSGEECNSGYCSRNSGNSGISCRSNSDCRSYESCNYGTCRSDNGRRVRAQCVTREIGLTLPFGNINFYSESWLFDSSNPRGTRVESCICQDNGDLRLDVGDYNRWIDCYTCNKDGSTRTCYE